ncbi:MAG: hypothetical protein AAGI48_08915 [Verrucomicrobiota bacterium]
MNDLNAMKAFTRWPCLVLIGGLLLCVGGEAQAHLEESGELATAVEGGFSGGEFVPPPSKPPILIPDMEVRSYNVVSDKGREITTVRGEDSIAPDILRSLPLPQLSHDELIQQEPLLTEIERTVFLSIGATVFDKTISIVTWRHPEDPDSWYEATVALNFGIFASAPRFKHKGVSHRLMLMHSHVDTTQRVNGRLMTAKPAFPPVAPEAFLITKGDPNDLDGIAPIVALMDLYAVEKDRLLAAYADRERARAEASAWRAANPPGVRAEDVAIWIRPHRGSRYIEKEGASR